MSVGGASSTRRRIGARQTLGIALIVLALAIPPAPVAAGTPGTVTTITMISEGESLGAANERIYTPADAPITVDGDAEYFRVWIDGGTIESTEHLHRFSFGAPSGQTLSPGLYTGTSYLRSEDAPSFSTWNAGSGCSASNGRFEIFDIHSAPDGSIDRLDLTYEIWCGGAPLFGEIRFNAIEADTDLNVANTRLRVPERDMDVAGPTTPVWLTNTSDAPVTLGQAHIAGEVADSFSIVEDPCSGGALAPGARCVMRIAFDPTVNGMQAAELVIPNSTSVDPRRVPLSGFGMGGHSALSLYSEPGEPLGKQAFYDYTYANATFAAMTVYPHGRESNDDVWSFGLSNGTGRHQVGTYTATQGLYNDGPGATMGFDGASCSAGLTKWTVHEAEYVPDTNRLLRINVTFEHRCGDNPNALYGSFAWRSTQEPKPLPVPPDFEFEEDKTAPPPVSDFTVIGNRNLSWVNPQWPDFDHVVVRYREGEPPENAFQGQLGYEGAGETAWIDGLSNKKTYGFSAFAFDAAGNPSYPRTGVLRPTELTASLSANPITAGETTRVDLDLRAGFDEPIHSALVEVLARTGQQDPEPHRVATDHLGRASLLVAPKSNTSYRATFQGARGWSWDGAPDQLLRVRPRIVLVADDLRVKQGDTVRLQAAVSPFHENRTVTLQRWRDGQWRNPSDRTLGEDSAARWRVRPSRAGTLRYRVVFPRHHDHARGISPTLTITVLRD